ncbi:hypothetical protein [Microvirga sp. 2TAF3]|uniref:hypothetical protein n=1 Tax=Microvirga sp. 2TAF3 TaxID=3233014 RepID=UPI003F954AB7
MTKRIRASHPQALSRNGSGTIPNIDRIAFQETLSAHFGELLAAAQQELRYRVELGELGSHNLTPEELVDEALLHAWRDRSNRFSLIGVRAWLLAMLFRTAEDAVRREAKLDNSTFLFLQDPEPVGLSYDDDETFWEWYQPEETMRHRLGIRGLTAMSRRLTAAAIEEMARTLGLDAYQVFLLHEVYRLPLRAVTLALRIPSSEAERLLAKARHYAHAATGQEAS